jgi:transposase
MDHFAGLDVSVEETSVCIVDDTGRIVREVKVASEPEELLAVLKNPAYHFKRIGLEAGPMSQWLFSALAEASLPVVCVETRHMRAVLKAQINKTDRNDARGIAQMMRGGALPSSACEDATQPETADAADPSQAAAVECHRH